MLFQTKFSGRLIDWLAIFWLGVITYLSMGPLPELPVVHSSDKIEHAAAYASLVVLATARRRNYIVILALAIAIVAYGGLIEFIQPFVNRHGELDDFLANCAGVILGIGITLSLPRLNAWFGTR